MKLSNGSTLNMEINFTYSSKKKYMNLHFVFVTYISALIVFTDDKMWSDFHVLIMDDILSKLVTTKQLMSLLNTLINCSQTCVNPCV